MSTPYERPTDELRQVQHRSLLWSGDWYTFFVVQRKWLVQDGEPYESEYPVNMFLGPRMHVQVGHQPSLWVETKEEWRNLPIVEVKDL